ncbi:MAG: hypothetical protein ACM3SV_04325 [Betaproteobacteria bacterium]
MATKPPSPPKKQQWPSLEAQLAESRVTPGSPLAHLIQENQDFDLIAGDRRDAANLPPWLRVLWRKKHPADQSYPRALLRLHSWLLKHQDLKPGAAASPAPSPFR